MDYWHKYFVCPFFKWDEEKKVACEGGSKLLFPNKNVACEFMDRYCANNPGWKMCTFAQTLLRYHERNEENGKQED